MTLRYVKYKCGCGVVRSSKIEAFCPEHMRVLDDPVEETEEMKKRDELADPKSCLNKAKDDETLFVLLDRDEAFAETVRWWAYLRVQKGLNTWQDAKIREALETADRVEALQKERKRAEEVPAVPEVAGGG